MKFNLSVMRNFLLLIIPILSASLGFAQVSIDWQKTYGGSEDDDFGGIIAGPFGGYVFCGNSESSDGDLNGNNGFDDFWVAGINANQQIIWQRNYGGSDNDYCHDLMYNNDSEIVLAGGTYSFDGDVAANIGQQDVWLMELNLVINTPVINWKSTLGGSSSDNAFDMALSNDNGYVVVGTTNSNDFDVSGNNGSYEIWVLKMDTNHVGEWQRCIGGSSNESGYSVVASDDGGYVVLGSATSTDNGIMSNGAVDILATKLDGNGTISWQKNYGGQLNDEPRSIEKTNDGGYIFVGSTSSSDGDVSENKGGNDAWIVKLNGLGEIEWERTFGGTSNDVATSVIQTIDGGYAIGAYSRSIDGDLTQNKGNTDAWIIKINSEGILTWQKTFGGSGHDYTRDLLENSDGSYILGARTESNDGDVSGNHGQNDLWIVKVDAPCLNSPAGAVVMNNVITCSSPEGENFRWLDCSNNSIINGENSKVFVASQVGDYAVIVSNGTCIDTSDCLSITTVGLNDLGHSEFQIYPNPTTNWVQIKTEFNVDKIEVYDMNGRLIKVEHMTSFSTEKWGNGLYILKIKTPEGVFNAKLIKN